MKAMTSGLEMLRTRFAYWVHKEDKMTKRRKLALATVVIVLGVAATLTYAVLPPTSVPPSSVPLGTLAGKTTVNVLSVDAFTRAINQAHGTNAALQRLQLRPWPVDWLAHPSGAEPCPRRFGRVDTHRRALRRDDVRDGPRLRDGPRPAPGDRWPGGRRLLHFLLPACRRRGPAHGRQSASLRCEIKPNGQPDQTGCRSKMSLKVSRRRPDPSSPTT